MSLLGANIPARGEVPPGEVATIGAKWARMVALPDYDATDYMWALQARGVRVLLVFARESFAGFATWEQAAFVYAGRYAPHADAIQVGNEPDHVSDSSWTLSHQDLNKLLRTFRAAWPKTQLVGPGLVSGQATWVAGIDLSLVEGIAVHPYAKQPGEAALSTMLNQYAAYGKMVWITEYDARTWGMAAYLKRQQDLVVALAFCFGNGVADFDMRTQPKLLADFVAASGGVVPKPTEPHTAPPQSPFWVGDGVRDYCAKAGFTVTSPELYENISATTVEKDGERFTLFWRKGKLYLGEEVA